MQKLIKKGTIDFWRSDVFCIGGNFFELLYSTILLTKQVFIEMNQEIFSAVNEKNEKGYQVLREAFLVRCPAELLEFFLDLHHQRAF